MVTFTSTITLTVQGHPNTDIPDTPHNSERRHDEAHGGLLAVADLMYWLNKELTAKGFIVSNIYARDTYLKEGKE